jgi:hypothetical protein
LARRNAARPRSDLVRHRIGAIVEPGHRLGEREGGAFGVGEIRRVAPRRDREQALVGFAGLFGKARMTVDTDAAAIDLARTQVDQFEQSPILSGWGGWIWPCCDGKTVVIDNVSRYDTKSCS